MNNTTQGLQVVEQDVFRSAQADVDYWYASILVVLVSLGLTFNTTALAVLVTSAALRQTTTGMYLMSLEISDSVFLLGEFIRSSNSANAPAGNLSQGNDTGDGQTSTSREQFGWSFMHTYDGVCKTAYFLRYVGQFASAWIVVVISIERLVKVSSLRLSVGLGSGRVALLVTLLVNLTSIGVCAFPFWTIGVLEVGASTRTSCRATGSSPSHEVKNDIYLMWNRIVLAVGSLCLPWLLVLLVTSLTIRQLAKARQKRGQRLGSFRGTKSSRGRMRPHCLPLEYQFTAILLSVASFFLILRLPYTLAYNLYINLHASLDGLSRYRLYVAYKVTDVLATSNYAISFFLYCLRASAFRRDLVTCFLCGRRRKRRSYLVT